MSRTARLSVRSACWGGDASRCLRAHFSTNDNIIKSKITLRKQIAPILKLIHPDFFSQHHKNIQQDNMHFLQSLNALIDNLEQLQASCIKRATCDITSPLLSSYKLNFHIKVDASPPLRVENGAISETKAVHFILAVPQDLTFRQIASSSVIQKRIAILLHRVGPVFEAVGITSPWELEDPNSHEEKSMPWERNTRQARSSTTATHGFRKRSVGISVDDPAIKAVIEEKLAEKIISGNVTSIFSGSAENARLIKGDIDQYIRNGHIVAAHLSPVEQLQAVKRVRDFLMKYGHLVNFSFNNWNSVIILVDGSYERDMFKTEALKTRKLVMISAKFRPASMVSFLHKSVPQSRLVMPEQMDDIKQGG